MPQKLLIVVPAVDLSTEPNPLFLQPFLDNRSEVIEGAAHDEQDVARIDSALFPFARLTIVFNGLDLGNGIMGNLDVHLGLFHGFQKRPLDPGP